MNSHIPRKRFGQNFLRDRNIIDKILTIVDCKPNEPVVEIGPGQGALTFPLLQKLGQLNVIELDRDLIELLSEKAANY